MKIYEIGTGYTSVPARVGAATEIVVEELTRSFIKNGKDATIIDIKAQKRDKTDLPIIEVKVPAVFTKTDVSLGVMHKLKRVVYSVCLAKKLKNILKPLNEKVVFHFHNQYNLFFFLKLTPKKLLKKVTIAYTVHSYIWANEWSKIERTVKAKYFQEIFCIKNADLVFVLNDITRDHLINYLRIEKERILKVRNGVNTQKYLPLCDAEVESFKKTNGFENKKVIFQAGAICERKNQFGSLQMLAEYLKKNPDVEFVYAGGIAESSYHQAIIKFAHDNGIENQIKYVGELTPGEELNLYYNMASCVVFTSVAESFGLVIIESISAGTPVIVGNNLMFTPGGGYSMYHNKEEFVSLVADTFKNKKRNMSSCADFVKEYNWDFVAKEHYDLFLSKK